MGWLAVDPAFQGQSLGAALLADALDRAIRSQIAAYALMVEARNGQAAVFYRHHGFMTRPDVPLAAHRLASQVVRELMREFVQRQREAWAYDEFLHRKVEAGRTAMRAGLGRPNEEVEAEFTARRAGVASEA